MKSTVLTRPVLSELGARLDVACISGGVASVWLGGTDGSVWFERDAHLGHYAASTMKLPLVLAAYQLVADGHLTLAEAVPVHNSFSSAADGSVFAMDPNEDQDPQTWAALGATRTVEQLARHAIIHSGNLATNLLLERVGTERVAQVLAQVECSATTVVSRGIEDLVARAAGLTNTVTAADLARLMVAVAGDDPRLGGQAVCAPVLHLLADQRHVDQIPAGLPDGTWTASKSGWIPGVSHDVALVRPASGELAPFVLAVCTTLELSETDGAAMVAGIARDLWTAMVP